MHALLYLRGSLILICSIFERGLYLNKLRIVLYGDWFRIVLFIGSLSFFGLIDRLLERFVFIPLELVGIVASLFRLFRVMSRLADYLRMSVFMYFLLFRSSVTAGLRGSYYSSSPWNICSVIDVKFEGGSCSAWKTIDGGSVSGWEGRNDEGIFGISCSVFWL